VIDLRALRERPEDFRASQRARSADESLVDRVLAADERRRSAVSSYDELRAEQKRLGRQIAQSRGADKQHRLARSKELSEQVKQAAAEQAEADRALRELAYQLDNLVAEQVPAGGADNYAVVDVVGSPLALDFEPANHETLAEGLGALDMARGSKVSGSRFYYLTGVGALLELALLNMGMTLAVEAGFVPMLPPVLVKPEAMEGTGFLGQAAENVYQLADEDLYLVGTAEVPLAAYHTDEILDAASLPRRYAGYSTCFRREDGTYGKDTTGIFRVHQFGKLEMFSFCDPVDADAEHHRLLGAERAMLDALELPYRVIDVAAGDLGASAARKYDCEAWLPSQGRYREMTSASNCTTFQSRRLNIRMRSEDGVAPLATLNGTLVTTRWIVALLENHQARDGSVRVPEALRSYLGRDVLVPAC
jgi:seryl-tRNA synthetase